MLDGGHPGSIDARAKTDAAARGKTPDATQPADVFRGDTGVMTVDAPTDTPPTADAHDARATDARATDAGDGRVCGSFVPDPTLAGKRTACTFAAGATTATTLEDTTAARAAIKNVIILVHENRSFDHMYGTLGSNYEGYPATYENPKPDGGNAYPTHAPTACPADITHSVSQITEEWNNGAMDGFYKADGPEALWHYDTPDHPFYSWLMTTFAGSDRYFCGTLGPTDNNRRFIYGAREGDSTSTLFSEMDAAHVSWADYYAYAQPLYNAYGWPAGYPSTHPYADFLPALQAGTLPAVTFLDTGGDEHPPGSMKQGEYVVYEILQEIFKSPQWPHMALLYTYDEGGGFFDHVPPPAACAPSTSAADAPFTLLGVRVPFVVVSPYARAGYVSHIEHSHSSITRFVEAIFGLPAITARDANSDGLLDLFDFDCPPFLTPPTLPASPPSTSAGWCP